MSGKERSGILTAGNFIVDRIKGIDLYPAEDTLANIESEARSNGGGPYNILKDLSAMGVDYPLMAAGKIGADEDGQWIIGDCENHGIDPTLLIQDQDQKTSYTDVMTVRETGRRTFFHHRGANSYFLGEEIDFGASCAKIFHLAYLMLLDGLDEFCESGRTRASFLLERASEAGLITSIDVVSTSHPHFREIVLSSLPFTDHFFLNEIEAGRTLGIDLDPQDSSALSQAAIDLAKKGVRQSVILHTRYGAVRAGVDGSLLWQGSVNMPAPMILGANGAGDAFAAGYLHGLHQSWSSQNAMELAACSAAMCLRDPSPSGGLRSVRECLELGQQLGFSAVS